MIKSINPKAGKGTDVIVKEISLKDLRKEIEKTQDEKRFEHTLGVAYTAAALAMCHGEDIEKAKVAGLLHDCAKCISDEKKIKICQKAHVEITEVELRNPFLLHAKAGACLARDKFGVQDEDILNAILYHTTGRPDMSRLEKIIYIADYMEPSRKQAEDLPDVRKLAFQDLDLALIRILKDTLFYLQQKGNETDPMTQKTYDYYAGF